MKIVIKRLHMPYPNVRLPAGLEMTIEPDWYAEAMIARGFATKAEPAAEQPPKKRRATHGQPE